ncbi:MAG: hypothetical protein ACSHYF_10900 [Verrucomicrobiaceae bacterium]
MSKKKAFLLCALMGFLSVNAAELRTWTSSSGTTIEAKFQKMDEKEVSLVTPESKVIKVKIKGLSLADRHHLVEYAQADRKILTEVDLTVPEKDARIDKSTFKALEKKMGFGDETAIEFDLFESEHFFIASAGRFRANATAEMAERLWHGMAFQHMNFRKDWGDKKMVVIVTNDDETYQALGEWYAEYIIKNSTEEEEGRQRAGRLQATWMRVSGTSIQLPEAQQENLNAFPRAKVFRIQEGRDDDGYKKVFSPFATHGLAGMLLTHQMGGISSISPDGYFALTTGHSYFKEIQLAGKSETRLIDAGKYGDENEITSASGFEDGRSWAKTLRKLVRRGDIVPNLEKLLSYEASDLTPEQLVLIYSFAYYMQSESGRLTSFANMIRRIESNSQVPAPIEIAKLFGFETVEAFDADWTEFVKSTKFK